MIPLLQNQNEFLEQLYHSNYQKLMLYALSTGKNEQQAQEVMQDTFHEAILHIDVLMTHANPGGWLMQTLKYKMKEHDRACQRDTNHFLSLDTALLTEPGAEDQQLERVEEEESPSPLRLIRESLTPEEYHHLKRLVLDRASHAEVAKELNISVYASQKRLQRIREKLYSVFPERKRKK